jgi:hypothetical protein
MTSGADSPLRRIERSTLWVVAIAIVIAAGSGGIRAVLGVCGGALLIAVSYLAIQAGVDAALGNGVAGNNRSSGTRARRVAIWRLVKFITRFAILGAIAYVMMVRLRAHPVWMLVGASSLVAAATLEAVRTRRARP